MAIQYLLVCSICLYFQRQNKIFETNFLFCQAIVSSGECLNKCTIELVIKYKHVIKPLLEKAIMKIKYTFSSNYPWKSQFRRGMKHTTPYVSQVHALSPMKSPHGRGVC